MFEIGVSRVSRVSRAVSRVSSVKQQFQETTSTFQEFQEHQEQRLHAGITTKRPARRILKNHDSKHSETPKLRNTPGKVRCGNLPHLAVDFSVSNHHQVTASDTPNHTTSLADPRALSLQLLHE